MIEQQYDLSLLVTRELKRLATPDEIAYLEEHIVEWRAELVAIMLKAQNHQSDLQVEINQDIFHEHSVEYAARMKRTKAFINIVRARLSKLKGERVRILAQGRKQQKESQPFLEKAQRDAYIKGWGHAINYFNDLLDGGYTQEQAFQCCIDHAKALVQEAG